MTSAHAPQTVVAATLGTGRRSAPWPEGLPAAARAGADATTALLDALALGAALGRAGRTPGTLDPGAVPPDAPPDERPAAPPRAATLLALHLEQLLWTDDVLAHWLRTCADRGFRVPHAQLPEVLRVAAAQPRLQPAARAAAGARGAWLASLDPAQAWFTSAGTTHDPADWPLLGIADRVRLLFRLRATDPALGRGLLASTWATDAADARRTLLPALRVGLGPADADLLEGALDDRAAGVRARVRLHARSVPRPDGRGHRTPRHRAVGRGAGHRDRAAHAVLTDRGTRQDDGMTMLERAGLRRMRPRDPHEPHRTASTLELFFDLTFVVGVSAGASQLLLAEEHGVAIGVTRFLLVFFGVWWPWVNFTWFASAFDTDDWLYRLLTIVQMAGVLVTAAGIPNVVQHSDLRITVVGYVIMRLALVAQWLRASRDPAFRTTALRYVGGVSLAQLAWVALLLVPGDVAPYLLVVLIAVEFAVPVWSERTGVTPFHRHHIAERYGLFTLIVLGEGLLSVTNAIIDAQHEEAHAGELVLLGITALVLIAGMWWIYFARQAPVLRTGMRGTFAFGYVHYLVFGSAAAVASGIELAIARFGEGGAEEGSTAGVQAATTIPVAVFVLATWFLVLRPSIGPIAGVLVPLLGVLIGLAAFVPAGIHVAAVLLVLVVVALEVDARRASVL